MIYRASYIETFKVTLEFNKVLRNHYNIPTDTGVSNSDWHRIEIIFKKAL